MKKKLIAAVIMFFVLCFPCAVFAGSITLSLSTERAAAGSIINYSGTAAPDVLVPVKVLDMAGNIVFYEQVLTDANGGYSGNIVTQNLSAGTLKVVAGYGSNVVLKILTLISEETFTGSNGGGGQSTLQTTDKNWSVSVALSLGGTVVLGDFSLIIPPGALQGSSNILVTIEKQDSHPPVPSGFMFIGSVYRLTVNGQEHYAFNMPVTLKFTFNPAMFAPEETLAVYYYDETKGQWVSLGGTVSDNTITVTVNHFTKFAVMAGKSEVNSQKSHINLTDIAGHWAETNIKKLVEMGAISGYPDGGFKPNNTITRAEFTAVLVNAFNLTPGRAGVFTDTADHWARDMIYIAAANGIVSGCEDGRFGPDDPVTREQIAVMIVKAAKLSSVSAELAFTDSEDISTWAKDSIAAAAKNGIIKGYPNNILKPKGNATRAEAVTIIINALKY